MSKIATPQFDEIMKGATDFGSQYTQAYSKSNAIFMKGIEDIMGEVMSLAKDSAEKQAEYVKTAMSSKTINEFAEVQNKIAKSNYDDFVAGATKISEIGKKLIEDSAAPVNAEVTKAVKKATTAAKAKAA